MRAFGKQSDTGSPISEIEVPKPKIESDELLVKMMSVGVGVHDEYFHAQDVTFPYAVGIEGAGVIEEVGSEVTNYKAGERIAFVSMMQPKGGTWAEYAAISRDSLILPIPEDMSFEQAAAIPVAANTSLKILAAANLSKSDSIFIGGGAGALGTLLIQLARLRGLTVVASASKKNHEYMRELGADYAVDYHDADWQDQVNAFILGGVDAAVAIHPGTLGDVQKVVKDSGTLIAVSGDQIFTERGIVLKGIFNVADVKTELLNFMKQVSKGEVKLVIDKAYPFNEAIAALEQVKTRHTRGKLVISLGSGA